MKFIRNLLWKYFKADFLKLHFEEVARSSKYQLEWAHTDSNGRTYSRFVKNDIPLERIGKMEDYMDLMGTGLSRDEIRELIAAADNELALAFNGKKANVSLIGWVHKQILDRSEIILHTDLLYNFLAVQYIRDDEPINEWVESIHVEKVEQFKKDNKDSSTFFFFQVPELKLVNEFLKFSESEWNEYWKDSLRTQAELKQKIDHLVSVKKSSKEIRTPVTT